MTSNPLPPTALPTVPAPQRELRRSRSDRMLGGVCGGLAGYTGVDAVLWRAAVVALTLAGGAGLVLYAVLWVLTPGEPLAPGEQPHPVDRFVDRLAGRGDDTV
ncbi:phage shock protein C (PspC) family protein [Geodermatophilus dictyosporus]|uniref:Phage shock protein C (PspC) family protein n=1 Tax=Geodermatophilus dictyosporus TaxID=1523247 RepID=A0A1I5JH45_9ACTN|nr:PspC domain-containing protein [Geodermatophilus dictyosporus]SFO72010.1 phage shock protein C (PspC) family protein [Geodermatophilus dictyosporus]